MKPGNRTIRKHFSGMQFEGTGGNVEPSTPAGSTPENYTVILQSTLQLVVAEEQVLDLAGVAASGLDIANLGTAVARSMPPLTTAPTATNGYMVMDGHYISMRPFENLDVTLWRELMLNGAASNNRHEPESMLFANLATFQRSSGDKKPALTQTGTNNWAQADLLSADRLYYMRLLFFQCSDQMNPGENVIAPPSFCSTSLQLVKQDDNPHLMTMAQSYELHQS